MHWLIAFLAFVLVASIEGVSGGLLAALAAGALALALQQRRRIDALTARLDALEAPATGATAPPATRPSAAAEAASADPPDPVGRADDADTARAGRGDAGTLDPWAAGGTGRTQSEPATGPGVPTARVEAAAPPVVTQALQRAWRFLAGGNPIVRIGAVVLFAGLAFLARLAADAGLVPVELRLAGIALAGSALTVFGWRTRHRAGSYGRVLQGTGIAIAYLTLFAALRLYAVVPPAFALATMIVLVALGAALAVLQNAQVLAALAFAGGFAAPILTSTGGGDVRVLFGFYLLLNLGLVGIAKYRAWREVHLVGFVFTFGVFGLWLKDALPPSSPDFLPESLQTGTVLTHAHLLDRMPLWPWAEGFLVAFTLLYLVVPWLHSHRASASGLRRVVGGSLVFGLPMVAFAAQTALVRHLPFGVAVSALVLGAIYLVPAWRLHRAGRLAPLADAWLTLGILFASLAIPFALDHAGWTAAAWALEGAGLVWLGFVQQDRRQRLFGGLLQLAAGIAFLRAVDHPPPDGSGATALAALLIGGAAIVSAWQCARHPLRSATGPRGVSADGPDPALAGAAHASADPALVPALPGERAAHPLYTLWGFAWWFVGGLLLVNRIVDAGWFGHADAWPVRAAFFAATGSVLAHTSLRVGWRAGAIRAVHWMHPLALMIVLGWLDDAEGIPLAGWGAAYGVAAVLAWQLLLLQREPPGRAIRAAHAAAVGSVTLFGTWTITSAVYRFDDTGTAWTMAAFGIVPVVLATWLSGRTYAHPAWAGLASFHRAGSVPALLALSALWCVASLFHDGRARVIGYLPLVNPVELVFVLNALLGWQCAQRLRHEPRWAGVRVRAGVRPAAALLGFAFANVVLARTVAASSGLPWTPAALLGSGALQSAASILWTVIAGGLMWWAVRGNERTPWFVGAGLLAVTVAKLLLFDLSDRDAVTRIVSFIATGALMLGIGWIAPLPAARPGSSAPGGPAPGSASDPAPSNGDRPA